MRILFLSHHIKGNDGWSRYARDLISSIKKENVEVLCLVHEATPDSDIPQNSCLGAPLKYVSNPVLSFKTALKLRGVIKDFSPDIIHIIVEPYGTMIPFLSRRGKNKKIKVVMSVHSTFAFLPVLIVGVKRMVSKIITRMTYTKIDLVVCVSKYTKEHLFHHMSSIYAMKFVENKTIVISGGIDTSVIRKLSQKEVNRASPKEILCVGAVKPRKGIKESIDALALVKFDFVYRIVGVFREGDSYVSELRKKIVEYALEDKILLVGEVSHEELEKKYEKADLFLMLSTNNGADFEGFGLVYLEANAHGVPCIGPMDSGVSDAIIDGKTGYLVNQYDSATVAQKITQILRDQPIKSVDCVNWARQNSKEKKAKTIIDSYNKLMNI